MINKKEDKPQQIDNNQVSFVPKVAILSLLPHLASIIILLKLSHTL